MAYTLDPEQKGWHFADNIMICKMKISAQYFD